MGEIKLGRKHGQLLVKGSKPLNRSGQFSDRHDPGDGQGARCRSRAGVPGCQWLGSSGCTANGINAKLRKTIGQGTDRRNFARLTQEWSRRHHTSFGRLETSGEIGFELRNTMWQCCHQIDAT